MKQAGSDCIFGTSHRYYLQKWLDKYNYLPDAIVVEGPKAGGHLGFKEDQIFNPDYSLEKYFLK